ncbi:MAG: aminopeptidase, partial [Sphaerochaetaceae bacterium]|nr:aminopeptidase [Sphaerochaetaceae bacterium]
LAVKEAQKAGYKNLLEAKKLESGDRVYYVKMNKTVILFDIGTSDITNGMNILGAHIDSPRLDVKQNPVYEKEGIVYLNTHYYGGIKKYQWVALPLAINGVVFLSDGTKVDVNVGDDPEDPVFCISDILPHIAQAQMAKTAAEFIEGEKLDLILGCAHQEKSDEEEKDEKKPSNKDKILGILKEKYGFEEKDFASAELEVVPAGKARLAGFDKSLVLGYGQDDRVCSFTSLKAMLDVRAGRRTNCCILTDKEEIGSTGATGMDSHLLDNAVAELVARLDVDCGEELAVRRTLSNSYMLSSDVNSAYDPLNAELYDKQNSSFLARGVVLNKYTGSRGKSAASDANPEFIAKLRGLLDKAGVEYQFGEMAKVDVGGGGTIAKYCASYGMAVIDCGVPVMSMHAPWEMTSIYDIEQAYNTYKAFVTLK